VLRESVISDEGNRVQLSAALLEAGIWAMSYVQSGGCPAFIAVLVFVVIADNQLDIRPDFVLRTTPEYLQILVGSINGVIDDADAISVSLPTDSLRYDSLLTEGRTRAR
jgi:hypothetical protein